MAITYQSAGAFAYSASGGTSVSPAYPASIAAGDLLLLVVGQKPSAANGGSCSTPAGWTPVASLTGAGGYGTTLGADTGNTNLYAFAKVAVGGESGSLAVTVGTNGVCWARIMRVTNPSGVWDVAGASGSDTSAGSVSVGFGADPGVTAGDLVIGAMCIPTDVTTPSQFSAQAFSQAGVTWGTVTEIGEADSATGNDIGGFLVHAPVSAGTGSAAPTMTATAGGTTTNVRGPALFVRVREVVQAQLEGNAGAQAGGSGALTTEIPLAGAAVVITTASGALATPITLDGSAAAAATSGGALVTGITLSGAAIAQALASGGVATSILAGGNAQAQASAAAALATIVQLAGAAAAATQASGSLTTEPRLAAQAVAQALAGGALSTGVHLAAGASAGAEANAALTALVQLAGGAAGEVSAGGDLTAGGGAAQLAGEAAAQALAGASLTVVIQLAGQAVAQAVAAGDLAASPGLAGAAAARAAAAGAIFTAIPLAGASAAVVDAGGAVATGIALAGAAASVSSAGGSLTVSITLGAESIAHALASGQLATRLVLAGDVVAAAVAGGALSDLVALVSHPGYSARGRLRRYVHVGASRSHACECIGRSWAHAADARSWEAA